MANRADDIIDVEEEWDRGLPAIFAYIDEKKAIRDTYLNAVSTKDRLKLLLLNVRIHRAEHYIFEAPMY